MATTSITQELLHEVRLLRSAVIGLSGKDSEGEYRPAFVRRVLKAAREKPAYRFITARVFLAHLRKSSR